MNRIKAFWLGVKEFRLGFTTNCGEYEMAYEWGREIAHRVTFRYFEP